LVLADDDARVRVERLFQVVPTGWGPDAEHAEYVGTALAEEGAFVWHVFEVTSPEAPR
jgi:hypothetical protein